MPSLPTHLSAPARRRAIVAVVVLAVFTVAFVGYQRWRINHPTEETYQKTVSAFYSGVTAMNVGVDEHALTELLLATQYAPQEPAAWADLGLYELRKNNLKPAREALEKAHDLAPNNGRIEALLGQLEDSQGHFDAAVADYRQAVARDPGDFRARYALVEALDQQREVGGEAEAQQQLQAILTAQPGNLFVVFELANRAVGSGNADVFRQMVAQLVPASAHWTPEVLQDFKTVQALAAQSNPRAARAPLQGLRNQITPLPAYREAHRAVEALDTNGNSIGLTPLERFIVLPSPPDTPAAPDLSLTFTPQTLPGANPAAKWSTAHLLTLLPEIPDPAKVSTAAYIPVPPRLATPPALLLANGQQVQIQSTVPGIAPITLPFPGGAAQTPPTPDGILAVDWNNDFQIDLALAGAGGLKLFQQGPNSTWVDITGRAKLPPAIISTPYTGIWAADIDSDGDLDLILGTQTGPPTVLRNNGDGTFTPIHPFPGLSSGVRAFAWADFDGDSAPDAAFIDSRGRLSVLQNKRGGVFQPWPLSSDLGKTLALSAVDADRDGVIDLVVLGADGAIRRLSRTAGQDAWDAATLAQWQSVPTDGSAHLLWADLDNNGAPDLIATGSGGSQVWLTDAQSKLLPLPNVLAGRNLTVAEDDQDTTGRVGFAGLSSAGQPTQFLSRGAKNYGWQDVRLRSILKGDQRNNSFGIGGALESRAGLLYQAQVVNNPTVHLGLGTNGRADYIRMTWPNGTPQGEFDQVDKFDFKANQFVDAPERLIGSCPWLFADDGTGLHFVTDFIWRSPLGLRINAQSTAGVVQTTDWVKIRGDQLVPRNGVYNLSITADLWETHYFDQIALLTVDHPADTAVFVDERFAIPPPALAVHAMTPPRPVTQAIDDRGTDVLDSVRALDGRYLDTFGRGNYQGVTRDHWVEVQIGDDASRDKPLWLVAQGWIHPTDSSINVALSQGHHDPPKGLSLEVPNGKGDWTVAQPNLGFPEGKNKTILLDLTHIFRPNTPRRVRLRTNLEIYWDFIGYATGLPQTPLQTHRLALSAADLHYRGFSQTHQANASSPELPDYGTLAATGPRWRDLVGYYTRYGDVRELLQSVDDRYVIMNAGDELGLHFPAQPSPPAGWARDYVLIGDGWEKDGNYNTAFCRTVLPLPSHDRPDYKTPPGRLEDDPVYRRHKKDWVTYQTRYVSDDVFQNALRPDLSRP